MSKYHYSAVSVCVTLLLCAGASPAMADEPVGQPAVVTNLMECRAIADDTARLACFDQRTQELSSAVGDRSIVVADREEVRATNRSLFGLRLPRIRIFSRDDGEEALSEIETVIQSISRQYDGKVSFTVDDGARWVQTDGHVVTGVVREGTRVTIRRAAFGSYFAAFAGSISVRVRRVN